MHNNARILFLGTPKIAADVLDFLINEGYNIIGAVSQIDRETDRKGRVLPTEVKSVCLKHNLPIYQYEKINVKELQTEYKKVKKQLEYNKGKRIYCPYLQVDKSLQNYNKFFTSSNH